MKNTIMALKNCNENDVYGIAVYAYRLICDSDEYCNHEEMQHLYNALVKKLKLEKHSQSVMDAYIQKLLKKGILTPSENLGKRSNPFDMPGRLPVCYNEDNQAYGECGQWSTRNISDINLVRCIFTGEEKNFQGIFGATFFCKPVEADEEFRIPKSIRIPAEILKKTADCSSVKFLQDALKLSDEETELLSCCYKLNAVKEIYDVINDLWRCDSDRLGLLATSLQKQKKDIRKLLRSEEKLHSFGLINDEGEFEYDAMACIEGQDLNIYFADIISKNKSGKTFALDSFAVKPEKTQLIKRLLTGDSSGNFLIYGAPGAGKTEYVKAIIKECGLKPLFFKNDLEVKKGDDDDGFSALYRLNCLLNVKQPEHIIVVDEAESILKTTGSFFGMKFSLPTKGTVNKMLETTENKVIWLMNYTNQLDDSTLRRFNYSMRFAEMPKNMLRSITETKLKDLKMCPEVKTEILNLLDKFHVTGSSVDNIVKTVKGMDCSKKNSETVIQDVRAVLEANSQLIYGKPKMREMVNDSYDLSVLNTSIPPEDLVEMVQAAAEYEEENRSNQSGIRMLFYGLSGTGKTELVRYLAEKLNKKIILKRASDIMGKYVGENEKNIREAFEEAEANDAVLLFDEADSFFADRSSARTSWERSTVNEFLTQMEEYSGILVCTTNLRKIMDPALERRFHIMTEFKPLKKEGIEKLLGKFFRNYDFDEKSLEKISAYGSCTPGDFGALSGRVRFIPKAKLSSEYIVNELCNIQKEKENQGGHSIGFGA